MPSGGISIRTKPENGKQKYIYRRHLRGKKEKVMGRVGEWPCFYKVKKGTNRIKIAVKDVGDNWTEKVIKVKLVE